MRDGHGQGFTDDFEAVAREEAAHLREQRTARGLGEEGPRSGLALSGGGIRSAAFGLGVTRALHDRGLFQELDYVSTVSGGGFSGGFVSWLRRRGSDGADVQDTLLPPEALQYIRRHADYLSPDTGDGEPKQHEGNAPQSAPGWASLFGVTLGQMLLSLGVYGSLLIGLFFLLRVGDSVVQLIEPVLLLRSRADAWVFFVGSLNFGIAAALLVAAYGAVRVVASVFARALRGMWRAALPNEGIPTAGSSWLGLLWFLLGLVTGALAVLALATLGTGLWAVVGATFFASVSVWSFRHCRARWRDAATGTPLPRTWLIFPALAALLVGTVTSAGLAVYVFQSGQGPAGLPPELSSWKGAVLFVLAILYWVWLVPRAFRGVGRVVTTFWRGSDSVADYLRGLRAQERSGALLLWAGGWLVLGTVPWTVQLVQSVLQSELLHLWLLTTAVPAAVLAMTTGVVRSARSPSAPRARKPAVSWGVNALCGAALYGLLMLTYSLTTAILDSRFPESALWITAGGLVVGALANLNFAGPGKVYRDRLAEAFLPDSEAIRDDHWRPARAAAEFRLSQLQQPDGPYPLVNASVDTSASGRSRYRQRGTDSFFLSPLYCGSHATGWRQTDRWLRGRLTLRDAIGISGAAVSPGAGTDGHGGARSRLVGATLALLDLRLGYWADNPNPAHRSRDSVLPPSLLTPGVRASVFGAGVSETAPTIRLSDGGHFDNLGLYELLRRRLSLIVVADGSEDPDYGLRALALALERARQDLDVEVRFEPGALAPPKDGVAEPESVASRGYAMGTIHYPGSDETSEETGSLIYLKPALREDADLTVQSFAATHPSFPFASTFDQNFDEDQFIAYEQLGHCIGKAAPLEPGHDAPAVAPTNWEQFPVVKA